MRGLKGLVLLVSGGVLWKGIMGLVPRPGSLLLPGSDESGLTPPVTSPCSLPPKSAIPVWGLEVR